MLKQAKYVLWNIGLGNAIVGTIALADGKIYWSVANLALAVGALGGLAIASWTERLRGR